MRKMASIQRIKELRAIPGADKIETAVINGWEVVVKKGEHQVGEIIVYCEIDSWIPNTIAPFLTGEGKEPKEYEGVKGERLKTVKLRKQISQGLVLPASILPSPKAARPEEGDDVTEALGILKWEAQETGNPNSNVQASKTRSFPYFIRKTDQERIQNYSHLIENHLDTEFEVTVKKDGSSLTVFRVDPSSQYYEDAKKLTQGKLSWWRKAYNWLMKNDEAVYGICSRNCMLTAEGTSNFHVAAAPIVQAMKGFARFMPPSYAIQAELVAPDIQGNYEKVAGIETHIFDIFNIEAQGYEMPDVRRCLVAGLGLNHATIVDKGTLRSIIQYKEGDDIVQKLLTYATGEGDNPGVMREGVVFKAMDMDFSWKAISNEYLLKKG